MVAENRRNMEGKSLAVLVTGGAGYIGSVAVEYLLSRGEQVVVLDNLVRGHRQALAAEVPFYHGDVGDPAVIAQIAREHELESCIHFAALAYIEESVQKPKLYLENNVQKGITLIRRCHEGSKRTRMDAPTIGSTNSPPVGLAVALAVSPRIRSAVIH